MDIIQKSKKSTGKSSKPIWEQIKNEEKDWFFNFIEKKVRNLNKKLKEIERLEEEQKEKELKQEQIEKIKSKQDVLEKISEFEKVAYLWQEAHKENQKGGQQKQQQEQKQLNLCIETLLDKLSHQECRLYQLVTEPSESFKVTANEIAKELINSTIQVEDKQWKGLLISQNNDASLAQQIQDVPEQQPKEESVQNEEEKLQLQQIQESIKNEENKEIIIQQPQTELKEDQVSDKKPGSSVDQDERYQQFKKKLFLISSEKPNSGKKYQEKSNTRSYKTHHNQRSYKQHDRSQKLNQEPKKYNQNLEVYYVAKNKNTISDNNQKEN